MRNKLKEAALDYAARGWPVFPANKDKQPYIEGGVLSASTDPEQIEKWWEEFPKANVAMDVGGAGMMVLDLDPGHDWGELEDSIGEIPETKLVSQTPRGGEHLFFALEDGEIVSPSASKIASKVDVRSFHSYVLLPPSSTHDGSYEWEGKSTAKPAFRTDEMVRKANAYREKHEDRDTWLIEPDLPENIADAIDWLQHKAKIAIEGDGGDHVAYATGAYMKSFGLSEEKAFELIWDYWNPRCRPPWEDFEEDHLRRKVEHAYRYNTSPPGNVTKAYQKAKAREMFKPVREKTPEGYKARGKFRVVDRSAMEYLEPPEWLIEDTIHREGFAVIYGDPGTYKTFTVLDMLLCFASGTGTVPLHKSPEGKRQRKPKQGEEKRKNWQPNSQGKVLFCAGESPDYFEARVRAWEQHYNAGKKIQNFVMVDPVPQAMDPAEWDIFLDEVYAAVKEGEFYDIIAIDTAAAALQGGDENNSKDMGLFIRMAQTLVRETGAAVIVIHHTNQQGAMRGNRSLLGAVDTQIRVDSEEQVQVLKMEKQRNAAKWSEARALRAVTVELDDGITSVAMVPGEVPKMTETGKTSSQKRTKKTAAKEGFDPVKNEFALEVLDDIVSEILKENPLKQWSTPQLAQAVAMDPRCNFSSATLTKRRQGVTLMSLREDKEKRANKLFDPSSGKWRWKKGLR